MINLRALQLHQPGGADLTDSVIWQCARLLDLIEGLTGRGLPVILAVKLQMKFTVRRENGSNNKFNKITASRENKKIEKHSACTFDHESRTESISKYLGTSEHSTPLKLPFWGRGVWYFCFCGFGHFLVRFLSRKTFFGFGSVFASVFVLCCSRFPVLGKNKKRSGRQFKPWSRFDAWTRQKCTSALS